MSPAESPAEFRIHPNARKFMDRVGILTGNFPHLTIDAQEDKQASFSDIPNVSKNKQEFRALLSILKGIYSATDERSIPSSVSVFLAGADSGGVADVQPAMAARRTDTSKAQRIQFFIGHTPLCLLDFAEYYH